MYVNISIYLTHGTVHISRRVVDKGTYLKQKDKCFISYKFLKRKKLTVKY